MKPNNEAESHPIDTHVLRHVPLDLETCGRCFYNYSQPSEKARRNPQHLTELWLTAVAGQESRKPNPITLRMPNMSMSIWGPTLQTAAALALCRQRDQGTRGGRGCEEDGPLRARREASKASWSGFEVDQWAELDKGSKEKSHRQKEKRKKIKDCCGKRRDWNSRFCEGVFANTTNRWESGVRRGLDCLQIITMWCDEFHDCW